MLELKKLSLSLSRSGRPLIENLSFTLQPGDKAVIIGEEGNGKSTLLQAIYNPELIRDYCELSGMVILRGCAAYLPQLLPAEDADRTVADYLSDCDRKQLGARLAALDLSPALARSEQLLGNLSGGEKIKLQLAKLLLDEPDLLLLDEPSNDLDIEALEWLENFLCSTRLPVLYVSHDERLIEKTANVILHLELLERKTKTRFTVSRCSYAEYCVSRSLRFDHQMQVAKKQRSDYQAQIARWQQIHDRVEQEQRTVSRQDPHGGQLLKKKMKAVQSQRKQFERKADQFIDIPEQEEAILTRFDPEIRLPRGKVVLDWQLDELRAGERTLARNLRLHVNGNEHIGIIGRNGSGKSTLMRLLWEELAKRRDLCAAYMPQDYAEVLDYRQTPIEFLAVRYTKEDITRARSFMGSMRFTHQEMTGPIGALSGGQRAKILFLDMVLRGANVLLLDEPTRNFSPLSAPVIRATLQEFGGAILSISHDRAYLEAVCDKVYRLTESGLSEGY